MSILVSSGGDNLSVSTGSGDNLTVVSNTSVTLNTTSSDKSIILTTPPVSTIEVQSSGIQGPQGPQGPAGSVESGSIPSLISSKENNRLTLAETDSRLFVEPPTLYIRDW